MFARLLLSLRVWFAILAASGSAQAAAPLLDRFGDPLPEGAVARLGSARLRPEQPIVTGAFSPDSKLLATAGTEGGIVFWDTATGKEARRLRVNLPGRLTSLRYSGDGKSLILVGDAGAFRIVDAVRGTEQRKLDLPVNDRLEALEVSRDGKIAATLDASGSIRVWDLAGGKPLHVFEGLSSNKLWQNSPGRLFALTADGKQLALPHRDGSLYLLDVASGKEVRDFEMPPLPKLGRQGVRTPQKVAISLDGRYLAYANQQTAATLCDFKTGKRLRQLGQLTFVTGLAFAPNSRFLAVSGPSHTLVFGVVSGKEVRRFPMRFGTKSSADFAPDGRTLAALGGSSLVPLWDVQADRLVSPVVGHQSPIHALAFFPDGKRLASAGRTDGLMVWDIAAGRAIGRHFNAVSFSSDFTISGDGARLQYVGIDREIHRWNPASGDEERQPLPRLGAIRKFTASPDDRTAVGISSAYPPQICLYDLRDPKKAGQTLALSNTTKAISQTLFSPDSRRLAAVSSDGDFRLWDRDTGRLVDEWKAIGSGRLLLDWEFAADGRSLVVFDGELRIREIPGGGERLHLPAPAGASALAYSADGRLLACGNADGSIVVYGTCTGKQLAKYQGKQGAIYALAFHRKGRLLASGGDSGTILVWKLSAGEDLPATLTAEQASALWQALVGNDVARAHRALAGLAAAPAQALPLLKERFRTLAKPPTAERLARLIAGLDDDSFAVREQATRELAEAGPDAANPLRTVLANKPSPEKKRRIKDLLERLGKGADLRRLHCQRVFEVLERIGTPEAKELLRDLAGKPLSDELKEDVQASLRRMGDKP